MSNTHSPSPNGQLPKEFEAAYASFYFGTGHTKRTPLLRDLWMAAQLPPGSVSSQEIGDRICLAIRQKDHQFFQKISDALKEGTTSSTRPPETFEMLHRIEYYVFMAFLHFQNQPLYVDKLPSRQDVWDRAKALWASMRLWGRDGMFCRHIDQLSKEEQTDLKKAIADLPIDGLNITRVFQKTGLLSLEGTVTK